MKTLAATGVTFLLIEAIAASAFGAFEVSAQEKKEAYVPAADVKTLLDKQLPGVEGQQVTILHGAFPAGWVGGMHYHSGPVYVYVLEGSFTVDEHGKPRQTIMPGQLYEEPIGKHMQARNMRASQPLKILLFQVNRQGEPLAYKAE